MEAAGDTIWRIFDISSTSSDRCGCQHLKAVRNGVMANLPAGPFFGVGDSDLKTSSPPVSLRKFQKFRKLRENLTGPEDPFRDILETSGHRQQIYD